MSSYPLLRRGRAASLAGDSYHRHQAPGRILLFSIAEQQVIAAHGAQRRSADVRFRNPRVKQLAAVGCDQVEKNLLRQMFLAVPGCTRREEEQRVALVNLVSVPGLPKQFSG